MAHLFAIYAVVVSAAMPDSITPQPEGAVPQMLEITWSAGPPMPQGMQDNHVTLIHNCLISVCGFCSGTDNDWKPGKYPRGFLDKVWGLDLAQPEKGWFDLPPFPGGARQGTQGAVVDGTAYIWGGFSYTEPYAYADGYRLSKEAERWVWAKLPELPSPAAWFGCCAIGARIYALGGADYDAKRFYTSANRDKTVNGLGGRMLMLDTGRKDAQWVPLSPCPGTARCMPGMTVIDGQIYVIGGVGFTASDVYCNVVDSWRYDAVSDTWRRLRDLPISGSGSSSSTVVYQGRYLLLPCGYQYDTVMNIDGSTRLKYGTPTKVRRTWTNHPKFKSTSYFNHFYVYDTKTNLYGTATALPFDDVASITVVVGDTCYLFPGETAGFVWNGEYFGHHPEFVLKGQIRALNWEP